MKLKPITMPRIDPKREERKREKIKQQERAGKIQQIVSDVMKTPLETIQNRGTKKEEKVAARYLSMYFCKKYTKLSLSQIGKLHGGYKHCTVLHGIYQVRAAVETRYMKIAAYYPLIERRMTMWNPEGEMQLVSKQGKLFRELRRVEMKLAKVC